MSRTYKDIRKAKRKRKLASPDILWVWRTPSHWTHDMMIVPARAEQRQKMHEVMSGKSEDDGNWPNLKKPHVYYW
jgi:hypothetical protein